MASCVTRLKSSGDDRDSGSPTLFDDRRLNIFCGGGDSGSDKGS